MDSASRTPFAANQGKVAHFSSPSDSKRFQRIQRKKIDMKRSNSCVGIVEGIEYDANRNSRIALVRWERRQKIQHRRRRVVSAWKEVGILHNRHHPRYIFVFLPPREGRFYPCLHQGGNCLSSFSWFPKNSRGRGKAGILCFCEEREICTRNTHILS